jgi:hypothetical protein
MVWALAEDRRPEPESWLYMAPYWNVYSESVTYVSGTFCYLCLGMSFPQRQYLQSKSLNCQIESLPDYGRDAQHRCALPATERFGPGEVQTCCGIGQRR